MYSASLYQNNRYGTEWFVLFGSAVCGLSAGLFWTVRFSSEAVIDDQAEAAIMVSYPEPWKRGRYLSMWLAYRNSGSILGGSINLAFSAFVGLSILINRLLREANWFVELPNLYCLCRFA